jgi:hypothetical protein
MKTKPFALICMLGVIFIIASCSKDAGEGGNSTIFGKVYVKDYNATFTVLQDEYYGKEIDVYIIYGDDVSFGNRTRTNYDGTYEFKYMRPGTYHIYAYSKDSTLQTLSTLPVIKDVEVTKKKQTVEVPEITIFN